ncbi:ribonuclease [Mycena sp. CBHHK59/15]|nr:ribonuclease [Mycena sp. CBHHK59/15]
MLAAAFLVGLVSSSLASPFFSPWSTKDLFDRASAISSGCSSTGTASCTNTSAISNLCCFQAPGGLLLQTQFWDTSPSTGPSNSWTIHGLWPDQCCKQRTHGRCPLAHIHHQLLTNQGASDTLSYMQTYWKDINGNDETFWEHEWSKVSFSDSISSTLDVACLPEGSAKGAEAVMFFNTVVGLFKTLPTYQWLADAGIMPSSSTTHTLASLTAALKTGYGFTPALDCDGSALSQISYYYHLKGSVIDGTFIPITAPEQGSCPSTGIQYLTKSGTPTTTTGSTSTATSIPTKAIIHAIQDGSQIGGLLSLGTWSTQSLATYTLSGTANSFTMTSSKGDCGISDGVFTCGSGVDSSTFSAVSSGGLTLLAYEGDTSFSSDDIPSGSTVYAVNTGSDDDEVYTLSIVST